MISELLKEKNRSFFYPLSMQLDLLKNHPQTILKLARWLYEEWKPYDPSLTLEKLIHSFGERLNSDQIPISFVVVKEREPIACISLKEQSSPELMDFPKNSIWLGSLQVIPEERNKGIGQALLKFCVSAVRSFGHTSLYLYTSNADNVKWYVDRGAEVIETRPFRGHTITIMQISTISHDQTR